MQSLGNHLRADQDINLAGFEIAQDAAIRMLVGGGIGIHALDPRLGKQRAHNGLDPLGADTAELERGRAARWTARGRPLHASANMTTDFVTALVPGHFYGAVGSTGHVATSRT